jgi:Kre9/KNH-like N-terminal Ig-like domain/Divergent InlB B-repeat domain
VLDLSKTVTFQAVFLESSVLSDIQFNYADVNFDERNQNAYNAGGSATVGVQIDPTHGEQYCYNQRSLTNGLALLFQAASGEAAAPSLTVVSPNGGESWSLGSAHTIQWSYLGTPGTTVSVDLLRNGSLYSTLSASASIGNNGMGSFSWTLETTLPPDMTYSIRITSNQNSSYTDTSNAKFSLTLTRIYTLTVTKAGAGSGTVTGSHINCGTECIGTYAEGTPVTLTATASPESTFAGWNGACSTTGGCSLVMDTAKSVSATFDSFPSFDFGAPPPYATVVAGQAADFAIVLNGHPGFTGYVSLSCTSGLPAAAACTFNPALVSPGSGTVTSTLRVSTTARTTADDLRIKITFASLVLPLALVARRRHRSIRMLATALILSAVISACGGGGPQVNAPPKTGTPSGTYTITIDATSGATTRTQTITLAVN